MSGWKETRHWALLPHLLSAGERGQEDGMSSGQGAFLGNRGGTQSVIHLCPKQTWGTVDKSPTGDATDEKLDSGTRAGNWGWKKERGFRIRELILLKHKSLRGEHFSCWHILRIFPWPAIVLFQNLPEWKTNQRNEPKKEKKKKKEKKGRKEVQAPQITFPLYLQRDLFLPPEASPIPPPPLMVQRPETQVAGCLEQGTLWSAQK